MIQAIFNKASQLNDFLPKTSLLDSHVYLNTLIVWPDV